MKIAKRVLALVMALCLSVGLIPCTSFAAEGHHPFVDVPDGEWYSNAIQYVYEKGMMNGTTPDSFSPNALLTRGMLVTILYRRDGQPQVQGGGFRDVKDTAYYGPAVAWASVHGPGSKWSQSCIDTPISSSTISPAAAVSMGSRTATGSVRSPWTP